MPLIIREAVQRHMESEKKRAEALANPCPFSHPSRHSDEAKAAWENFKDTRGGIMLPYSNADWFALGYDSATKHTKGE